MRCAVADSDLAAERNSRVSIAKKFSGATFRVLISGAHFCVFEDRQSGVRVVAQLEKRAGGSAQAIAEDALSALRRLYSAKKRGEVCSIWPRLTRPERVA